VSSGRSISRSRDIPGDGLVETSLRLPPVERDYDASFWQTFEVYCRFGQRVTDTDWKATA